MTNNIPNRLRQHNAGETKSIRPYLPYKLIYKEEFETKKEASIRERQIKRSGVIRKNIKEQLENNGPIV